MLFSIVLGCNVIVVLLVCVTWVGRGLFKNGTMRLKGNLGSTSMSGSKKILQNIRFEIAQTKCVDSNQLDQKSVRIVKYYQTTVTRNKIK